jgi:pantoate--beta-alanine ligase
VIVLQTIEKTANYLLSLKGSIGFVPTMGALHDGHMTLIRRARKENDICVCSIFVNPTQFDNQSDLDKYPRTLEKDCQLLEKNGCDIVFAPSAKEMYPSLPNIQFDFGPLERVMEGANRKGHFNGVGIVVSKLFHIVKPHKAYFGLKDLQQVGIIKQLVRDLSFQIEIVPCDTSREENGLARSSRNERLPNEARAKAGLIQEAIQKAKGLLQKGVSVSETKQNISDLFKKHPDFRPEYFEITDFETLQPISEVDTSKTTAICTAVWLADVRLIDNTIF